MGLGQLASLGRLERIGWTYLHDLVNQSMADEYEVVEALERCCDNGTR
jgi:hypothetical protein